MGSRGVESLHEDFDIEVGFGDNVSEPSPPPIISTRNGQQETELPPSSFLDNRPSLSPVQPLTSVQNISHSLGAPNELNAPFPPSRVQQFTSFVSSASTLQVFYSVKSYLTFQIFDSS